MPSEHARSEARKDVADRVNSSDVEEGEVVKQAVRDKRKIGLLLIAGALLAALLVGVVLFLRTHQTDAKDTALCEKLDRLIVKIEVATAKDPKLTQAEKTQQHNFWEAFRNDQPSCRTPGP